MPPNRDSQLNSFRSYIKNNHGDKKNGGFLELLLQLLTYSIQVFSVSLMKVYQICYLTVKDSIKSMNAVRNNSPIINTGVIDESPSYFLLCIFQKVIIIFKRLSLINGTQLRHADFTITFSLSWGEVGDVVPTVIEHTKLQILVILFLKITQGYMKIN